MVPASKREGVDSERENVVLLLAMLPPVAMAAPGVIDFETVPGGVAADQVAISNQYQAGFGVTFSLSTGAVPFLEQVGDTDPGRGFYNTGLGVYDAAAAGFASHSRNCSTSKRESALRQ